MRSIERKRSLKPLETEQYTQRLADACIRVDYMNQSLG